jgi:predicted nucleotidyltransferase
MQFGLKEKTINEINDVFAQYAPIEQVILYGSRAKGNFRNGSDIDLTIIGKELTFKELLKIENQIDDLLLPYKIDLSQFEKINNPDLVAHIKQVGQVFFDKNNVVLAG